MTNDIRTDEVAIRSESTFYASQNPTVGALMLAYNGPGWETPISGDALARVKAKRQWLDLNTILPPKIVLNARYGKVARVLRSYAGDPFLVIAGRLTN